MKLITTDTDDKRIQEVLFENTVKSRESWMEFIEAIEGECIPDEMRRFRLPRPFEYDCACKTAKISLEEFFSEINNLHKLIDNNTMEYKLISAIKNIYQLNLFNRITLCALFATLFPILIEHDEFHLFDLFTILPYLSKICKTKGVWKYIGPYQAQRLESLILETHQIRIKNITNYLIVYLQQCINKGPNNQDEIQENSVLLQLEQLFHETRNILTKDFNLKLLNIIHIWRIMREHNKLTSASVIVLTLVALPSMENCDNFTENILNYTKIFELLTKISLKKTNRKDKTKFYSTIRLHARNTEFIITHGDQETRFDPTELL